MTSRMKKVDAVILGFGWTGTIMAKELTEAGLNVVALERGPMRDTYPDGAYPQTIDELTYNSRKKLFMDLSKGTVTHDIWSADIQITPDGNYLYTSERNSSVSSELKIDKATGGLTFIGTFPTEKQPRGFNITPDGRYLICTGEKSDMLSVFDIDPATGKLKFNGRYPDGHDANWVEIVKL